ncbi:MAG: hypothetical protein NT062_15010 [Proteobacteria bacterium]|nr:hypothetical protein [Pseudomonadota bacterium]
MKIGAAPPAETRAALAGALCDGINCRCRDLGAAGDGGVGVPDDEAHKRYEIRVGPSPQALWLTIGGSTVLYKSAEHAQACFYVDLTSGEHPIEMRASAPEGVSAAWSISELGTKTRSWYDTFAFACGSPGVCSFSEMDGMKQEQQIAKRNLRDPCGSTKIKSVTWDTGKAPDNEHPSELLVRATLDIYKFTPFRPHGDDCGKGGGRAPNDVDPGTTSTDPAPAQP